MDKYETTIELYNKCAEQYQDKFMDMDLYNDTYDLFCNLVEPKNPEIFEIACGPGNITRYLLAKRPDFKITGIDLASGMIELAEKNNPSADFILMDCRNISSIRNKYEGIMCGFCLPYLSKEDSIQLIHDVSNLLKEGGIFYLSCMEDDYGKSGFEKSSNGGNEMMYIHYHQADYLTMALKENGLKIESIIRKDYPEKDGTFTTDLIFLSIKK